MARAGRGKLTTTQSSSAPNLYPSAEHAGLTSEDFFPDLVQMTGNSSWPPDLFTEHSTAVDDPPVTRGPPVLLRSGSFDFGPTSRGLGIASLDSIYARSPALSSGAPTPVVGVDVPSSRRLTLPSANMNPRLTPPKRPREDDSSAENTPPIKRQAISMSTLDANEEERALLRFKDQENLPWKDIAWRFQSDLGKVYQVPALQMRYRRLRDKLRIWTEADVSREHVWLAKVPSING